MLKEVAFLKKKKIFGNLSKKYNKFRYKLEMKFSLTNFIFLKLFSVDSGESFIDLNGNGVYDYGVGEQDTSNCP